MEQFGRDVARPKPPEDGASGGQILAWRFEHGRCPNQEEIEARSALMTKRGSRDAGTQRSNVRLEEIGLPPGTIQVMFGLIELEEQRLRLGAKDGYGRSTAR